MANVPENYEHKEYKIRGLSFSQGDCFDLSVDNELLLEHVGRIIMTSKMERVNNLEFGSLLETFIFNRGIILKQHVDRELKAEIEKYEPRVSVRNIELTYSNDTATLKISLLNKSTLEELEYRQEMEI